MVGSTMVLDMLHSALTCHERNCRTEISKSLVETLTDRHNRSLLWPEPEKTWQCSSDLEASKDSLT